MDKKTSREKSSNGNLELESKQKLTVLRHVVNPRSENTLVRIQIPELETEQKNRKVPLITINSHGHLVY